MGLKCSVLGHKYGDATVERDREEQGSEVVITIREMETCDRCGTERIVSENKEVTSIATPDEPGGGDQSSTPAEAEQTEPVESELDEDERAEDGPDVTTSTESPASESESGTATLDETATEPEPPVDSNEGAEILDAEADEPVTDDELADPSIGTATDSEEPVATDSVEEDAVIIDDREAADDDGDVREPGAWPEEPDDTGADAWNPNDAIDDEESITAPDAGTDQNAAVTVPDGQFRCPECGYTTLVESSSLRAGDFCPDCHKGSLVHEPRDGTRKE